MTLPWIITAAVEALQAVPPHKALYVPADGTGRESILLRVTLSNEANVCAERHVGPVRCRSVAEFRRWMDQPHDFIEGSRRW